MLRLDFLHTRPDNPAVLEGLFNAQSALCSRSDHATKTAASQAGAKTDTPLFDRGELLQENALQLLEAGFELFAAPYEPDTFYLNDTAALIALGGERANLLNAFMPKADRAKRTALIAFVKEAGVSPYLPDDRPVLDNTLLIRLPGIRARQLVNALKLDGIAITNGEGCTLGLGQPSFTLQSYGFNEDEAREAISLSWEPDLDEADLTGAVKKLLFRYRQIKQLS